MPVWCLLFVNRLQLNLTFVWLLRYFSLFFIRLRSLENVHEILRCNHKQMSSVLWRRTWFMLRGKGLDMFPWDCDRMTWCPRAVRFIPRVSGILFLWIKADAGIGHKFCRSAGNNILFHLPARILFTYSHFTLFYSFCYIAKHKREKKTSTANKKLWWNLHYEGTWLSEDQACTSCILPYCTGRRILYLVQRAVLMIL